MSILPEAQQAAVDEIEDWLQHCDDPWSEPRESGRFVQQAIDAATAKLTAKLRALVDNAKISARIHVEERKVLERDLKDADGEIAKLRKELELAWGIIANAHGGDWEKGSPDWQDAATRWRDRVMPLLRRSSATEVLREAIAGADYDATLPSATTSDVVVTKDGVPFEDQAEGIRQFKEASLRKADTEKKL